jgi:hypothetical protein
MKAKGNVTALVILFFSKTKCYTAPLQYFFHETTFFTQGFEL